MSERPLHLARVGERLPALTLAPLERRTLALFAGASGDHMPLHIDIDAARRAGMPDVFGHGMLSMAYLGRLLTDWAPQARLRRFGVRFGHITHLDDILCCSGAVVGRHEQDGELVLTLELQVQTQHGQIKTVGEAAIAIPSASHIPQERRS